MIFDKKGTGIDELVAVLGFFSRSFDFENIRPYIPAAIKELRDIFSAKVVEKVEEVYAEDGYDTQDASAQTGKYSVVWHFQRAAAAMAYIALAPNSDLSHGNEGRNINITENQRTAYDDQISRSDKALRDIVSTEINSIYTILSEDELFSSIWKESAQYKAGEDTLLPTPKDFSDAFYIADSWYFYQKITPTLRMKEYSLVRPMLGEKYLTAKEDVSSPLYLLSRRILAVAVMADVLTHSSLTYESSSIMPAQASLKERQAEREALMVECNTLTEQITSVVQSSQGQNGSIYHEDTINNPHKRYFYND